MSKVIEIALLIYPDVEVLDFAGPYEVFTTANRVARAERFRVALVAREPQRGVRARAGLQVRADAGFDDARAPDVLLVPGGVVSAERREAATVNWIARTAARADLVASVCTGVFLLAAAGVLPAGLAVTTHWEDIADLRREHPALEVVEHVRWVDRGRYVTSAGISAGIDMSLHLVERLAGRELALATARQLQFDWTEHGA